MSFEFIITSAFLYRSYPLNFDRNYAESSLQLFLLGFMWSLHFVIFLLQSIGSNKSFSKFINSFLFNRRVAQNDSKLHESVSVAGSSVNERNVCQGRKHCISGSTSYIEGIWIFYPIPRICRSFWNSGRSQCLMSTITLQNIYKKISSFNENRNIKHIYTLSVG